MCDWITDRLKQRSDAATRFSKISNECGPLWRAVDQAVQLGVDALEKDNPSCKKMPDKADQFHVIVTDDRGTRMVTFRLDRAKQLIAVQQKEEALLTFKLDLGPSDKVQMIDEKSEAITMAKLAEIVLDRLSKTGDRWVLGEHKLLVATRPIPATLSD